MQITGRMISGSLEAEFPERLFVMILGQAFLCCVVIVV